MTSANSAKPRVGVPYRTRNEEVTGQDAKLEKYLAAVRQAGGEPVRVSLGLSREELRQLAQTFDGVVLPGSPADVNPALYAAARHPLSAEPDPDRERTDFTLLEHCFAECKPLLAICYGIQSLNVFQGGTLIPDVPAALGSAIEHDHEDAEPESFHPVQIEPGSRLARLAHASQAVVNSSHHQSIQSPGRELRIVSRAADGVIEAVEWTGDDNWVTGVQWHPERMAETDSLAQALFQGLVAAAAARKAPLRV